MRNDIKAYLWICDDCGKEAIMIRTLELPEGWEEVDDGPRVNVKTFVKNALRITQYNNYV